MEFTTLPRSYESNSDPHKLKDVVMTRLVAVKMLRSGPRRYVVVEKCK